MAALQPFLPHCAWDYLRTLGLQEPRHAVSHNPVSWLKPMSLSKTRPYVASQQVASQSPNTYHKIQSFGMFQASALGKSQVKSLWVFTPATGGTLKQESGPGCGDLEILLSVVASQGPQACRA